MFQTAHVKGQEQGRCMPLHAFARLDAAQEIPLTFFDWVSGAGV